MSSDAERLMRSMKMNGRVPCVSCGREISAGYMRDEGLRCADCDAVAGVPVDSTEEAK